MEMMHRLNYFLLTFFLFLMVLVWFPGFLFQAILAAVLIIIALILPEKKKTFRFLFYMSPFILITLLIHLFVRIGSDDYWGSFSTPDLWYKAGYFTIRNMNVLLIVSLFMRSRPIFDVNKISQRLQNRMIRYPEKKHFFTAGLFIGIQYFRVIQEEYQSLLQVHRILGVKHENGPLRIAKYYASLIIPLFIGSLERADQLSVALTTRGFGTDRGDGNG